MPYTVEKADEILQKWLAYPPVEKSKQLLSKQGMVSYLVEGIRSLQDRGYTLEQVAESARGMGFEISTPTLKSYLQRAKATKSKRPRRQAPATPAPPTSAPKVATKAESSDAPTTRAVGKGGGAEAPKSTSSEFLAADRKKL